MLPDNVMLTDPVIVVTGAFGFLGSVIVKELNTLGHQNIVLVDDFVHHEDKWRNIEGKQFLEIVPPSALFDFLEGREKLIEHILHFGACADATGKSNQYLFNNNYRFSIKLCEYAIKHNIRFLYATPATASSSSLHSYLVQLLDSWVEKTTNFNSILSLKYFHLFGPNEFHKENPSIVYKIFKKIKENNAICFNDDVFDLIYVKDAVRITCNLLFDCDKHGIFNIGSGTSTKVTDVISILQKILNSQLKVDIQKQSVDSNAIAKSPYLPFPLTPLDDALNDYVNMHLLQNKIW